MAANVDPGNEGQLRDWDGQHGTYWAARADTYDASVGRYQPALLEGIAAQPGNRILDVGCGSGQVAIDVVRATPDTSAVGVDLSSAQLEVARARAGDLPVTFVQADAQVYDFGPASYDVVASRTGTMFFADPCKAFTNLAGATAPGGRLAMLVWRNLGANEWIRQFFDAVGRVRPLPALSADAPGPFALSDPDRTRKLLEAAQWREVHLEAHDQMMWFGPEPDRAADFIRGQMAWLFSTFDDDEQQRAEANLRDVMTMYATVDGVLIGSGAWLVTARRR
jgi:SAM-dependent methyltransferase